MSDSTTILFITLFVVCHKHQRPSERTLCGRSAWKTKFAPEKGEEARYFEGIETCRGGWYFGCRYNARTRRQIEATKVYVGKGVGRHLTQSYSECTDWALMHDAPSQWGFRN